MKLKQLSNNILVLDIPESRSSLLRKIEYDCDNCVLIVYFRKSFAYQLFEDVSLNIFEEFSKQSSIGKYFLHFIKQNFKQTKNYTMSEEKKKLVTKNEASNKTRFIKISINVRDIIKPWLHEGEKGTYLNCTLVMKPDGEVDSYGNLGFISQDVPSEVYKAAEAEKKGSGRDIKTPILGNASEIDWEAMRSRSSIQPGTETGKLHQPSDNDDLPF